MNLRLPNSDDSVRLGVDGDAAGRHGPGAFEGDLEASELLGSDCDSDSEAVKLEPEARVGVALVDSEGQGWQWQWH